MPSFIVRTKIKAPMQSVWTNFNAALLAKLSPPLPTVKIIRFDGCAQDDLVILELNLIVKKVIWSSKITASEQTATYCSFTDEGIEVPLGITQWKHVHRIEFLTEETCQIVDHIRFTTSNTLLDMLLFPFIWGMIVYRIPLYKHFLNT